MATTRQLRGGDFVLRVDEEDLDILLQGVTKLQESPPDFSKVEPAFRETMERTYHQWRKRLDKLDTILQNVAEPYDAEEDEDESEAVPEPAMPTADIPVQQGRKAHARA